MMTLEKLVSMGLLITTPLISHSDKILLSTEKTPISHNKQLIEEMNESPPPAHIQKLFSDSEKQEVETRISVELFDEAPNYMAQINTAIDTVHNSLGDLTSLPEYDVFNEQIEDQFPFTSENKGAMYLVASRQNEYVFVLDDKPTFTITKKQAGEVSKDVHFKDNRFTYKLSYPVFITPGEFNHVSQEIRVVNTAIAEYLHLAVAQSTLDQLTNLYTSKSITLPQVKSTYLDLLQEEENIVHASSLGVIAKVYGEEQAQILLQEKYDKMKNWRVRPIFDSFENYDLDTVLEPIKEYLSKE